MRKLRPLSIFRVFSRLFWVFGFVFCMAHFQRCERPPRTVQMAFYHWKTEMKAADFEGLKSKKMYIRLFDVDWDDATRFPKPMAELAHLKAVPKDVDIVPVVFITNKTFAQLAEYQLDTLARRVFEK